MGRRRLFRGAVLLSLCLPIALIAGGRVARSAKLSVQQVCLSNLSRLAQATLMYVSDNDGQFPPHELQLGPYTCQWGADNANPWLRWPVLLDPYVRDRSVYLCEGVEAPGTGHTVASRPGWITSRPITTKGWPNGPCGAVYPPGWGGSVTDSAAQGGRVDANRFRATLGAATNFLRSQKVSGIEHPSETVLWADSARMAANLGSIIWANACRVDCADLGDKADYDNCSWSRKCGAAGEFTRRAPFRARFTRHQGGSNIAFVDGHVEWRSVTSMIAAYRKRELLGVEPANATKGNPWYLRAQLSGKSDKAR